MPTTEKVQKIVSMFFVRCYALVVFSGAVEYMTRYEKIMMVLNFLLAVGIFYLIYLYFQVIETL